MPEFVLNDLKIHPFNDNFKTLTTFMQAKNGSIKNDTFLTFMTMQMCDAIDKQLEIKFLQQLIAYINVNDGFVPLMFQEVYNQLAFSFDMNYKTFLQKISQDCYTRNAFRIGNSEVNDRQIKAFCNIGSSLKLIMHELSMGNWSISKYLLGTHVIVAQGPNLDLFELHCEEHQEVFEEFEAFMQTLPLMKHSDFIMSRRDQYRYVDKRNMQLISKEMPARLLNKINDLYIVVNGKQVKLGNATVICMAHKTDKMQRLNIDLMNKCMYGNRYDLVHKYH